MIAKRADAERLLEVEPERVVRRRPGRIGARAFALFGRRPERDPGQAVSERTVWRRLKEAGAQACGEAVVVGAGSLEDGNDAGESSDAGHGGEDRQDSGRTPGANRGGGRDDKAGQFVLGGTHEEGPDRFVEGEEAFDDLRRIEHAGRSLRMTVFAAATLLLASVLNPSGLLTGGLALGWGLYFAWLAGAFWAVCRECSRGLAVIPESLGGVRLGLSAVALALLWSGDASAAGHAVWIAAAALAIGGLDDGDRIAAVCLRREVPPWRAVGAVFRESRAAWRENWRVLYGGTVR